MADSVWGKPSGAWADAVDEQEEKHGAPAPAPFMKEEAFPSLSAAAKEQPSKKKAGKAKPVSLGAFLGGSQANRAPQDDKSILLNLPKASSGQPREERDSAALGGAFRDYGGDRGGGAFAYMCVCACVLCSLVSCSRTLCVCRNEPVRC